MASKRTFGVEIECGHPTLGWGQIAERLKKDDIPTYPNYGVGYDGSGIEVRSPVYKGQEGFDALRELMDYLDKIGCFVTRSDGMHVHIGASELQSDEEACRVLARTWYNNQDTIGKFVSSHRFGNVIMGTQVCAPVTSKEIERWGQGRPSGGKDWGARYKACSIYNVPRKKTVEFRLHEGCLDPDKAIAWIQFCLAFVDYAISKREVIKCASKIALLRALDVPQDAAEVLRKPQKTMPKNERVYRTPVAS